RDHQRRGAAPVAQRERDLPLLVGDAAQPQQRDDLVALAGGVERSLPRLSRLGPVSLLLIANRHEARRTGCVLRVPRGDRQPPGRVRAPSVTLPEADAPEPEGRRTLRLEILQLDGSVEGVGGALQPAGVVLELAEPDERVGVLGWWAHRG